MVSDRITAHRNFEKSHAELTEMVASKKEDSPDLIDKVSKAVSSWEKNRMIHEELDHYEEFGKVLGKHPKLVRLRLLQKIEKLSGFKASRRIQNLTTYISRDRKKLESMREGPEKNKFKSKLEEFILEKQLLETKFNVNGEAE